MNLKLGQIISSMNQDERTVIFITDPELANHRCFTLSFYKVKAQQAVRVIRNQIKEKSTPGLESMNMVNNYVVNKYPDNDEYVQVLKSMQSTESVRHLFNKNSAPKETLICDPTDIAEQLQVSIDLNE